MSHSGETCVCKKNIDNDIEGLLKSSLYDHGQIFGSELGLTFQHSHYMY